MNFEFNLKTRTVVGKGSLSKVGSFILDNGYTRVGLMVDISLKEQEAVNTFLSDLKNSTAYKIAVEYYYDLPFEPDYDSLDRVKLLFKEGTQPKVDVIVAIGGGSTIDFAKGIATLVTNHDKAIAYKGFPKGLSPSVPVIAIPSTAGTASEVTFNAVFTDPANNKKLGINTHNNFPVMAVLDPDMTKDCPYRVALSSGLDALVHTVESFAAKQHNPYTRMFAKEAFRYLINNIEKVLKDKNNEEAREYMLFGAYLAGISLFNSGSGPAGAISYATGTVCKIPHGIAGGMILPYLVKHNADRGYTDYAELYDLIDGIDTSVARERKSSLLADHIYTLYERLDVWNYLRNYKVDVRSNSELQQYLSVLQGAFDQNPIPFTYKDSCDILDDIFGKRVKSTVATTSK
jgi:alcohol dehydrogenase class IV